MYMIYCYPPIYFCFLFSFAIVHPLERSFLLGAILPYVQTIVFFFSSLFIRDLRKDRWFHVSYCACVIGDVVVV